MKKINVLLSLLIMVMLTSSAALAKDIGGKDNWLSKKEFAHFIRHDVFNGTKLTRLKISISEDGNYMTAQVQEAGPRRKKHTLVYRRAVPESGEPTLVHSQSYDNPRAPIYSESNTCFVQSGTLRFYLQDYPDARISHDDLGRINNVVLYQHARHSPEYSYSYYGQTETVASASYYDGYAGIERKYTFYEDGNIKSSDIDIGKGWRKERARYAYRYYDKKDYVVRTARYVKLVYSGLELMNKTVNKRYFDKKGRVTREHNKEKAYEVVDGVSKLKSSAETTSRYWKNGNLRIQRCIEREFDINTGKCISRNYTVTRYDRNGEPILVNAPSVTRKTLAANPEISNYLELQNQIGSDMGVKTGYTFSPHIVLKEPKAHK